MAMLWIERIMNRSSKSVVLRQSDKTYHPVINGHQYANQDILVHPGQNLDASWFVVPWADYGKLTIEYVGASVYYVVGPMPGRDGDFLRAYNGATDELIGAAKVGPRGGQTISSISFHFICSDSNPTEFQFWNASGSGNIPVQQIVDDVVKVTDSVANLIKAIKSPTGG